MGNILVKKNPNAKITDRGVVATNEKEFFKEYKMGKSKTNSQEDLALKILHLVVERKRNYSSLEQGRRFREQFPEFIKNYQDPHWHVVFGLIMVLVDLGVIKDLDRTSNGT